MMPTRVGGRPRKKPLRPVDRERKSKKEGEMIIRVRLFVKIVETRAREGGFLCFQSHSKTKNKHSLTISSQNLPRDLKRVRATAYPRRL
jgi:hypothetical protein